MGEVIVDGKVRMRCCWIRGKFSRLPRGTVFFYQSQRALQLRLADEGHTRISLLPVPRPSPLLTRTRRWESQPYRCCLGHPSEDKTKQNKQSERRPNQSPTLVSVVWEENVSRADGEWPPTYDRFGEARGTRESPEPTDTIALWPVGPALLLVSLFWGGRPDGCGRLQRFRWLCWRFGRRFYLDTPRRSLSIVVATASCTSTQATGGSLAAAAARQSFCFDSIRTARRRVSDSSPCFSPCYIAPIGGIINNDSRVTDWADIQWRSKEHRLKDSSRSRTSSVGLFLKTFSVDEILP